MEQAVQALTFESLGMSLLALHPFAPPMAAFPREAVAVGFAKTGD